MKKFAVPLIPLLTLPLLSSCNSAPSKVVVLDASASSKVSGSYKTGNYGYFSYGNVEFGFYRAVGQQNDFFASLIAFSSPYGETLGGSIYNSSSIDNIEKIVIEYSTASSNGVDQPTVYYGANGYESSSDFDYSTDWNTFELNASGANYFKIESGDSNLNIKRIEITRDDSKAAGDNSFKKKNMGQGQYRIRPTAFKGTLVAGVSQVSAPIETELDGNRYMVKASRNYTYYSFDYVVSHPEVASNAAMVDPIDVANYYSIFKEAPANYVTYQSKDTEKAKELFGEDVRQVSTYDRIDGYLTVIPYAVSSSSNRPLYHEFDIAFDENYQKSRGVGRLVAVETGLKVESYGNGEDVACYYTDDHYATFQEYGNLGKFLPRFSASYNVVDYGWSEPSLAIA